jgi:hypothetical protein
LLLSPLCYDHGIEHYFIVPRSWVQIKIVDAFF